MGHGELMDFCRRYKRIFCYGAGKYAMTIREFLCERNIDLERFVVTNKDRQSRTLMGLPVDNFSDVVPVGADVGIIIGVGETKHSEIQCALQRYGIKEAFSVTSSCFEDIERHTAYNKHWHHHDRKICVLLYHRVCELSLDVWGLAIKPSIFEEHIKYYKEKYNILRFDEDWSDVREPSLIITLDDGYADNLHYALPILEKYEVPATVFVSTGNIDSDKEFWWNELERIVFYNNKTHFFFREIEELLPISTYEEKKTACQMIRLFLKTLLPEQRDDFLCTMMSDLAAERTPRTLNRSLSNKELRKLASSPYITIGGHTVTHNMLSAEPKEMQEWEVATSKRKIEGIIDKDITIFSYPFGSPNDINEYSIESVRKAGYKWAATTSMGLACQEMEPFVIPRNGMPFCRTSKEIQKQLRKIYTLL